MKLSILSYFPVVHSLRFEAILCAGFLLGSTAGGQSATQLAPAAPPSYMVGSIPPSEVLPGDTLAFQLQSAASGATFSYSIDSGYPAPQGSITLDSSTGAFSYKPSAADKFQFRITFQSSLRGQASQSQSVLITPLSNLAPEGDIIAVIPQSKTVPDEADSEFTIVTQSRNSGTELFNTIQQTTSNFEISGKTVIFDQNDSQHALFSGFNNQNYVKTLSIYAETLVVRSPLKLPGTNLVVFARHLRFEDRQGQAPASIETTPVSWTAAASQFQNGKNGQQAGNVRLIIGDFFSGPATKIRIIADGGKAQDAGPGAKGGTATWAPPYGNYPWSGSGGTVSTPPWGITNSGNRVGNELAWKFRSQSWGWVLDQNGSGLKPPYPAIQYVSDPTGCSYGAGQPAWPNVRGGDGVPPGVPGTGGPGAAISSSLEIISGYFQAAGGASGLPGSAQPGGPANPPTAAWLKVIDGSRCGSDYFNFQVTSVYNVPPGNTAQPIPPAQPQGPAGSFTVITEITQNPWLHPYWIRQVLAHAKDTYRGGNMQYASNVLQDYANLLGSYESSAGGGQPPTDPNLPPDANSQLQQASDEVAGLLHRLANNMDYFGNAAGWVPLLSLQATMNAFNGEVDADVPLLYLSLYLQSLETQNETQNAVLNDTLSQLSTEATSTATDLNSILGSVPGLQAQAAQIGTDLQNFQQTLQQREDQLVAEAQQKVADQQKVPFWKKALRTISAVAEVVPAFQPALGTIGAGLNFITNVDTSQPLSTVVKSAPDLSSLFEGKTWTDSEASFKSFVNSAPFSSFDHAEALAKTWHTDYKNNSDKLDQILPELQQTQAPANAVNQELLSIEAQDSEFNDLTLQVRNLQAEKQAFAQKIAQTMQSISSDNATINKDLLSEASVYQSLNSNAQFDHGMVTYVKDMERRARERLLRYQYYMAKAFEYRFLQSYPGDLNIDNVVQAILNLPNLKPPYQYSVDLSEIKSAYKQSIRNIVNTGITQLTNQPPERSVPLFFTLTLAELQQLNRSGEVSIDLGSLIAGLPSEDNRHLENLAVTAMTVNGNCSNNPACRVRVEIAHNGQSTETWNGHSYNFNFGGGLNDQPFTWGASYDLPSKTLSPEAFSVPGLSLLQTFLTGDITPSPGVTLFALPGADGFVTISQAQQPSNLNAQITSMQIQATVDFYRNKSGQIQLSVGTANGATPYIKVNQQDVTGRSDGLGSFQRTFTPGTSVTLTAEPIFGSLLFKNWVDGQGKIISTSSALTITPAISESVQAVYATSSAPPSGATFSLSATVLPFGTQLLLARGSPNVVTVTNSGGSGPVTFSTALLGINAHAFSETDNCGSGVQPGGQCSINVTFSPQTIGYVTALLVVKDTVQGSSQSALLTGVGFSSTVGAAILNKFSGKALDDTGFSMANGTLIQQWNYWGGSAQSWLIAPLEPQYFSISSSLSRKYLDDTGLSVANGTPIQQWDYWGGDNQRWKFVPTDSTYFEIMNKLSAKALDDTGFSTEDGTVIQQWDNWGGDTQKWQIAPLTAFKIINKFSGKALDDTGFSTQNGTSIQQWDYWGGDTQKWQIIQTDDANVRIVNVHSWKALDVTGKSAANGTIIQQWDYWGGDNQQWELIPVDNVYFKIINKLSGKALDDTGFSTANGSIIQQWDDWGGDTQMWQIMPATPSN